MHVKIWFWHLEWFLNVSLQIALSQIGRFLQIYQKTNLEVFLQKRLLVWKYIKMYTCNQVSGLHSCLRKFSRLYFHNGHLGWRCSTVAEAVSQDWHHFLKTNFMTVCIKCHLSQWHLLFFSLVIWEVSAYALKERVLQKSEYQGDVNNLLSYGATNT